VAMVLRVRWSDGCSRPLDLPSFRSGELERDAGAEGLVELLYILRTAREGDRWSGQVAFPGGKQEPSDRDDRATSARETLEEVGLDLETPCFRFLGCLSDRPVTGGGRKIPNFFLAPLLWLQVEAETPGLRLQASEVAAWRWVPLRALRPERVTFGLIVQDFRQPQQWAPWLPQTVLSAFEAASFPAIPLDACATSGAADATSDAGAAFNLWGLTLMATSDALVLGGGTARELAWPPIQFRSTWANFAVAALCGAAALRRPHAHRPRLRHIFALAALAAGPALAGFFVAQRLARWVLGTR